MATGQRVPRYRGIVDYEARTKVNLSVFSQIRFPRLPLLRITFRLARDRVQCNVDANNYRYLALTSLLASGIPNLRKACQELGTGQTWENSVEGAFGQRRSPERDTEAQGGVMGVDMHLLLKENLMDEAGKAPPIYLSPSGKR